ncbi:hypothetical protein K1719_006650 [Acacia pycnantha]|nr:hypothetical protein K1719_006650 [Acacia pycnantha]
MRDVQITCAGILCTFILGFFTTPFFDLFSGKHRLYFTLFLQSSPTRTALLVFTRLIMSLKIIKSDISKLTIAANKHSYFLCSLLLSSGHIGMWLPIFCKNKVYKINDRGKARLKCPLLWHVQLEGKCCLQPQFLHCL